ncbi:unnamed protein product [Ambrosiozyma monospora]|uniref:Unnamed protein product n=1 Tax=Ambrosiozyma monospora TaxID=43982 RepID=A0ACB5SZP2_AMBMO|nr:unnamed protein product [Ambrosiozyma monospora]
MMSQHQQQQQRTTRNRKECNLEILNLITQSKLESLQHILRQLSLDLIIEIFAIIITQLHIQQWERLYNAPEFQQIFKKVLSGITVRFLGDHVFEFGSFDCDMDEENESMNSLLDFMQRKDIKFERFDRCDFSTPFPSDLSLVELESPEIRKRRELLDRMAFQSTDLVIGFKELTEISRSHYDQIIKIKTQPHSYSEFMFVNPTILQCLDGGSFRKLESFTFLIMNSISVDDMLVLDWFINKLQNGVSTKRLRIILMDLKAETHLQEFQNALLHSCVPVSEETGIDGKVVLSIELTLEDLSTYFFPIAKFIIIITSVPIYPVMHQKLISSCPNLEESWYFYPVADRRVVETTGEFPVFRIASDTITHYMYECYGSGWQCEISGLTNLKFLTLGSMIRGSVIGRCIPDSVECMEIKACSFLDLDDSSDVYLFKLPKALKRLKDVDSKVCFKNLRSLKCLEEAMLEFGDDETRLVDGANCL